MEFPAFWFEGNLWHGWIKTPEDFQSVLKAYKDDIVGTELMRLAKENIYAAGYKNFGLRTEHHEGKVTLGMFLEEHGYCYDELLNGLILCPPDFSKSKELERKLNKFYY